MFKKNTLEDRISFLTPKASLKFAPGHMRNIEEDNLRLNYSNIFNLNKNSQIDVVDSGNSLTAGLEFSNLDFINNQAGEENFSLYLGQVFSFEENSDMPSKSSLDQKVSDLVGEASVKISDNFSIKN